MARRGGQYLTFTTIVPFVVPARRALRQCSAWSRGGIVCRDAALLLLLRFRAAGSTSKPAEWYINPTCCHYKWGASRRCDAIESAGCRSASYRQLHHRDASRPSIGRNSCCVRWHIVPDISPRDSPPRALHAVLETTSRGRCACAPNPLLRAAQETRGQQVP